MICLLVGAVILIWVVWHLKRRRNQYYCVEESPTLESFADLEDKEYIAYIGKAQVRESDGTWRDAFDGEKADGFLLLNFREEEK